RGRAHDPATTEHLRELLRAGDVLVQPYLPSIETTGETSLVLLAGRVSHTVAKLPAEGEFRIHDHRGGTYAQVEPSPAQVDLALTACEVAQAITGEAPLYARADLVAGDDGRPLLMELELIEPSLYLHTVPAAVDDLADVVIATLAV
ncbi:MAG: ATP-grasp domain-containing protein, partial [Acidimicrobiales bacterium]